MNYLLFKNILKQISNEKIKNFTIKCLESIPSEFEQLRASSTGKYHPPECNEVGGIIVHIQRACYFANMLFNAYGWENYNIKGDIVLSSLLLHDIAKKNKYEFGWMYPMHPQLACKIISKFKNLLDDKLFQIIYNCILHHMGNFGVKEAKKPMESFTFLELMVYQCDYLASKKEIKII